MVDFKLNEEKPTESTDEELNEAELAKPLTPLDRRTYIRKWFDNEIEGRIEPLRELKFDLQKIQDAYCRDLYELEKRYHEEAQNYYEMRDKIINGINEPKDEETEQQLCNEQTEQVDLKKFAQFFDKSQKLQKYFQGVPNFWLHILTTCDTISQIVYERDLDALRYLSNITIEYEKKAFTLEFHFKENPYFDNNVLSKKYFLENKLDEENEPCGYEGYRINKCTGCRIHWKREKNLTVKFVSKSNGRLRLLHIDSFFNFFQPPVIENAEIDDETREILNVHFKIGNFFREEIIPKALLYFTGDIVDDMDDDDELIDEDDDCSSLIVRDDNKHFANVARILHKINWN